MVEKGEMGDETDSLCLSGYWALLIGQLPAEPFKPIYSISVCFHS